MLSSLGSHAIELKQQGAVEAARDGDNPVTAQDAENAIVEESKKGGAAAFQFDPDASPAEKAAQAGAVSTVAICCFIGVTANYNSYRLFRQASIARKNLGLVLQLTSYVPTPVRHIPKG
jgi:hypothetical protein